MAYNSSIEFDGFETELSQVELDRAFDQFIEEEERKSESPVAGLAYLETYCFRVEQGYASFDPGDSWYAKHYADNLLAKFVSKVIRPGSRTSMEFMGESGSRWGYAIERNAVHLLRYAEPVVMENGTPVSHWLDHRSALHTGFFVRVYGDVEPEIVSGPFRKNSAICDHEFMRKAVEYFREHPHCDEDGFYLLDIDPSGQPSIHPFMKNEMDVILKMAEKGDSET
jgi:hypothetical protein